MSTEILDCVAMKHEIQQTLRERYADVSWERRNKLILESLRDDPHLKRLLQCGGTAQGHTVHDKHHA